MQPCGVMLMGPTHSWTHEVSAYLPVVDSHPRLLTMCGRGIMAPRHALVLAHGAPKAFTALSQRILRMSSGLTSFQLSARSTDSGKRVSGCG